MTARARAEFERCAVRVEDLARKERAPTRQDVRPLLIHLGELLQGAADPELEARLKRLREALAPIREEWAAVVEQEMQLACAEHIQGVDPRHLDHPRFDFAYVEAARLRLEQRMRALPALGLALAQEWIDRVRQADIALEPYLRARRGEAGAN